MTDEPDNLILAMLRRIDGNVARLVEDVADLKGRMSRLEVSVAGLHSDFAHQSLRIDRIEARLDRIERRLELVATSA